MGLNIPTANQQNREKKGVVSKDTVALRRRESSIQNFGFINGVDNVNWPPYRDSKKLTFRALALRQSESRNCGLRVVFIEK